ncbi:hypothetical protein BVC80_8475g12 [Macleaya cordata]|uniref:Uncharacterized protein n=1 Tax=Macleaya cordata TaxID=56857 RepID=A0A200QR79_MACCD|nr:hypothetical protein BVC80_8475g12 [Macleaya cordata]
MSSIGASLADAYVLQKRYKEKMKRKEQEQEQGEKKSNTKEKKSNFISSVLERTKKVHPSSGAPSS